MIAIPLAKKIAELFLILFAAAALVKTRVLKTEDSRVLSKLSLHFVTPCVIFNSFRKELTEQHGEYLPEQFYHAYPVFAAKLRDAAARYNAECDRLAELEAEGRIAVIAPSEPVSVGRLEPDMEKLGSLYSMGYQDGQRAVPEIQAYLKGEQQA